MFRPIFARTAASVVSLVPTIPTLGKSHGFSFIRSVPSSPLFSKRVTKSRPRFPPSSESIASALHTMAENGERSEAENLTLKTDIPTLTRHILRGQQKLGPAASGDLTILLNALQLTCKFIAHNIRRATLINLIGLSGASNATGDDQKKLDVLGNQIFLDTMKGCGKVGVIVSEEEDDVIIVKTKGAKYAVVCDPIDGSSNLDAGVSVGTIFGIYRIPDSSVDDPTVAVVLRPGTEMVVAGYCMYAASANLVLTIGTGNGVNGFTLDNALGEFILTHPNMRIPKKRGIYSVNEGNAMYWDKATAEYFESVKFPKTGKPYSARYIGSMVADVHRTLLYGGIFSYPSDSKSPRGKLRLLYECFPMAKLVEEAGGLAFDGKGRVLEQVPKSIHERGPVWLGSHDEVSKVIEIFKRHEK